MRLSALSSWWRAMLFFGSHVQQYGEYGENCETDIRYDSAFAPMTPGGVFMR